MTAAQMYAAKTTGSVMLPVAKITATFRVPRSRELARAGLLPLRLTTVDPEQLDSDEMKDAVEAAERSVKRLVCECSLSPRIVDHEPKDNTQLRYDDMETDDITKEYSGIMELATSAYFESEPATESKAQLDSLTLIAVHAKKWNIDPTTIGDWEPGRFDELMMFSDLLDVVMKNEHGE